MSGGTNRERGRVSRRSVLWARLTAFDSALFATLVFVVPASVESQAYAAATAFIPLQAYAFASVFTLSTALVWLRVRSTTGTVVYLYRLGQLLYGTLLIAFSISIAYLTFQGAYAALLGAVRWFVPGALVIAGLFSSKDYIAETDSDEVLRLLETDLRDPS